MVKKAEIQASPFDRLTMRWSDFNGLDLMVSLSNTSWWACRTMGCIVFSCLLRRIPV
jgi:hypothetical protein